MLRSLPNSLWNGLLNLNIITNLPLKMQCPDDAAPQVGKKQSCTRNVADNVTAVVIFSLTYNAEIIII